jgi:hypothetical protein
MQSTGTYRFAAVIVAGSLMVSSTAANAAATIDPWAALSAFGTQASRDAACSAATAAAAAGAAAAAQGSSTCVLPVTDPAPPPVVQNVPVPPPPIETADGGGFGISPLMLALGALAIGGLIYLLVDDDDSSPD